MSADPRVNAVQVNGELIVSKSSRIVTRSRAKNSKLFFLALSYNFQLARRGWLSPYEGFLLARVSIL